MQQALLDHLRVVTEEEQRILDGVAEVDKDLIHLGRISRWTVRKCSVRAN